MRIHAIPIADAEFNSTKRRTAMMKLKVTLFGVLTAVSLGIVAPYASAAESISIFGINWTMTQSEIAEAVKKAEYDY